ncbi:MAG TPA: alpha/beta hydrolase [Streptosporangiaceae bacterium]|nr:alpha/beta hydrolase [Streptosporangiaceae bacterium]
MSSGSLVTTAWPRSRAYRATETSITSATPVAAHRAPTRIAGPAVIVGHSGGGGTALGLALSDPVRVAALVLISPGVPDYPWPQDDPYIGEFVKLFAAGDREGPVRLGLATWAPAGEDAAVTAEIRAAVAAFLTVGDLEQPNPPAFDRLSEVRAPAVMVRGDREYPMVADCADTIASRIRGARRIVIPGTDHMLPLRASGRLAEIIAERAA